jgi:hypothetical protein
LFTNETTDLFSGITLRYKLRIKEEGGIDSDAFREFEALFMPHFHRCLSYSVELLVSLISLEDLDTKSAKSRTALIRLNEMMFIAADGMDANKIRKDGATGTKSKGTTRKAHADEDEEDDYYD